MKTKISNTLSKTKEPSVKPFALKQWLGNATYIKIMNFIGFVIPKSLRRKNPFIPADYKKRLEDHRC